MESNTQSHGIYRRLINLVFGIIGCTDPRRRPSSEVPIEDNYSNNSTGKIHKSNVYEGSEIMIEFRHRNSSQDTIQVPEKNGYEKKIDDRFASKRAKNVNIHGSEDEEEKLRPLQRVTSDIDKKSDAYIQRRRKAMGRNYSFDH